MYKIIFVILNCSTIHLLLIKSRKGEAPQRPNVAGSVDQLGVISGSSLFIRRVKLRTRSRRFVNKDSAVSTWNSSASSSSAEEKESLRSRGISAAAVACLRLL